MQNEKTPGSVRGFSGAGKVSYINQNKPIPQRTQAPRFHPPFLRSVEKIHAQGPRAIAELLLEIADLTQRPQSIGHLVNDYAALPPDMLRKLGVDQIPHLPPHEVQP